jgi:hypothetical protein
MLAVCLFSNQLLEFYYLSVERGTISLRFTGLRLLRTYETETTENLDPAPAVFNLMPLRDVLERYHMIQEGAKSLALGTGLEPI